MVEARIKEFLANDPDSPEEENKFTYLAIIEGVGAGIIRVLKINDNERHRCLMRKNQTNEVLINHYILQEPEQVKEITIKENKKRYSVLIHADDYSSGTAKHVDYNIEFNSSAKATDFQNAYSAACKANLKLLE